MITILTHRRNGHTLARLLRTAPELKRLVRPLTYQRAFGRLQVPRGPLIFSDFDLLRPVEGDAAAKIAVAAIACGNPVLNRPGNVLERYRLMRRLRAEGLNPVEALRLDDECQPSRYPVFLRSEDGWWGPESELIESPDALDAHLADRRRQGVGLKGRLALSFEAQLDAQGYYRKYGAFVIGDAIVPQHILRNTHWNVKSSLGNTDAAFAAEELAYVEENPHAAALRRIAEVAGVEYGRIDYTMMDGKPVVFEINTNPTFPRFKGGKPGREARRHLIRKRLVDAFAAIDSKGSAGATTHFSLDDVPGTLLLEHEQWFEDLPHSLVQQSRWLRLARYLQNRFKPKGRR